MIGANGASMKDWKSTAAGVCSFLNVTLTTISGILVVMNVSNGGPNVQSIHVSTWVTVAVNGGVALTRAWIGWITTNADAGAVAAALAPISDHPALSIPSIPLPPTAASLAASPKVP
jgi:hypothetical protein